MGLNFSLGSEDFKPFHILTAFGYFFDSKIGEVELRLGSC